MDWETTARRRPRPERIVCNYQGQREGRDDQNDARTGEPSGRYGPALHISHDERCGEQDEHHHGRSQGLAQVVVL